MSSTTQIASSAQSTAQSTASATFLERARQSLTRIGDYFNWRLSEAAQDFHFTLERESAKAPAAHLLTPKKQSREVTIAGFLVSPTAPRPIPLYEGSNYFAVKENAKVQRLVDEAAGLDFDYDIKISQDGIRMVSSRPTLTSKIIDSNESLSLGKERYSMKLLPLEYRLKKLVEATAEETHVG